MSLKCGSEINSERLNQKMKLFYWIKGNPTSNTGRYVGLFTLYFMIVVTRFRKLQKVARIFKFI